MQFSKRFDEACLFAIHLHANQKRKGTKIPYIAHLLAVTGIVLEHGGNENEAIAALLHDAVEDQGGEETRQEILQRFGLTVIAIVDGCTTPDLSSWQARKEAYIAHIQAESASVRLVSASDKLHNARAILQDYRTLGDDLWSRFNGGREGTLWYYRAVTNALLTHGTTSLLEELDRVVRMLEDATTNKNNISSFDEQITL